MTCHNPRRRRIIIISLFSPCLRLIPCVRESSRGFKKQWWWAVHLGIYSWRPEILQQLTWYRTWPSPGHGRYLPGLEGTVGLWHLALISTSHFCIFLLSPQYVVCIVWPLMRGYHFWAWSSQTRNKGEDRLPRLPRLPSRLSLRLVCGGDLLPQGWPGRVSGERSPEGFVVSWFRGHSLPLAIWVFPCFSSLAGADHETLGLRRLSHRLANGASSGGRVGRVDYIMWCTCQRMERYGKIWKALCHIWPFHYTKKCKQRCSTWNSTQVLLFHGQIGQEEEIEVKEEAEAPEKRRKVCTWVCFFGVDES